MSTLVHRHHNKLLDWLLIIVCVCVCVSEQLFQTIHFGLCDITWVSPWGDLEASMKLMKMTKSPKAQIFFFFPQEKKKKKFTCCIQKPWTPHKSLAATAIHLKEQNRKPETTHNPGTTQNLFQEWFRELRPRLVALYSPLGERDNKATEQVCVWHGNAKFLPVYLETRAYKTVM